MNKYEEIISLLSECVIACEACLVFCLEEDNVKEMTECIKLDRDCADICSLAVQMLARNSKTSKSMIGLCADICAQCAGECEKHVHRHCQKCAEACRNCEDTCKTYLDNIRQVAMNAANKKPASQKLKRVFLCHLRCSTNLAHNGKATEQNKSVSLP